MTYKYFIVFVLFSLIANASPKLYKKYGDEIERFSSDCKKFSILTEEIKKECKSYHLGMTKAFKYGKQFDKYIDSDNLDLDKAEIYNSHLHKLQDKKHHILSLVWKEMQKARNMEDVDTYMNILSMTNELEMYSSDYKFMTEHIDKFGTHPFYIKYKEKLLREKEAEEAMATQRREEAITREEKRRKQRAITSQCNEYQQKGLWHLDEVSKYMRYKDHETMKKHNYHLNQANLIVDKMRKVGCERKLKSKDTQETSYTKRNYSDVIMSNCRKKWDKDYRMIKYCVDKQTAAYYRVNNFPNDTILRDCKRKWNKDYRMIKYCYEKQSKAKQALGL